MWKKQTASWIATGTIGFACVVGLGGCEPPQQPTRTTPTTTPAPTTAPPVDRDALETRERTPITEPMVQEPAPDATRLAEQIRERFESDPQFGRGVSAVVQNGRITLQGQVRTEQEREAAQRIAEQVAGPGTMVTNDISVEPQPQTEPVQPQTEAQPPQADQLAEQVRTRLETLTPNVTVTAQDGRITLRGQVQTQQERESAQRLAEELAGPGKVTNEIEVAAEPQPIQPQPMQ